jgi:two-component system, NarL family, nitrate/nitrite response regulator NarL
VAAEWPNTVREFEKRRLPTKVLLLAENVRGDWVPQAVEMGIRGIVPKDGTVELLVKSILSVAAGEYWIGRDRVADVIS